MHLPTKASAFARCVGLEMCQPRIRVRGQTPPPTPVGRPPGAIRVMSFADKDAVPASRDTPSLRCAFLATYCKGFGREPLCLDVEQTPPGLLAGFAMASER